MNEILAQVKDLFGVLIALGWSPWPTVVATGMMLYLRANYEPSILEVNTPEALKSLGKRKALIFWGTFASSFFLHIGLTKPADAWAWESSIGFCIGHTVIAYALSSSTWLKSLLNFGGKNNANPGN